MPSLVTVVLFCAAAAVAPLLSAVLGRLVRVPVVVFEIVLGIVLGPSLLGWIQPTTVTSFLSDIGLAMLFFLAGNELDLSRLGSRTIARSGIGWGISLAAGILVSLLLFRSSAAAVLVGIAVTTTALGAILPVLRDAGELSSPLGKAATAVGAVGEFGPLVAVSLFLSGHSPAIESIVLIAFVVVSLLAIWLATRAPLTPLHRLVTATLHTSGQFAVRLVILILAAMACLSLAVGLDMLLGAFAAGVLSRVLLNAAPSEAREQVESKLEAVGFGFLVPFFFISTGVGFSVSALVTAPGALLLIPVFLVMFLLLRGTPTLLVAPRGTSWRDRTALIFLGATGLPIVVAISRIGVRTHEIGPGTGAALIAAGMLSVLIFPLIALAIARRSHGIPVSPRG
ncbi:MAG: cation:proton antiporter [Leifsonia sp.]